MPRQIFYTKTGAPSDAVGLPNANRLAIVTLERPDWELAAGRLDIPFDSRRWFRNHDAFVIAVRPTVTFPGSSGNQRLKGLFSKCEADRNNRVPRRQSCRGDLTERGIGVRAAWSTGSVHRAAIDGQ